MANNANNFVQKPLPQSLLRIGLILLLVGAIVGGIGFVVDKDRAIFSYLLMFVFLVSLVVGSVFLVALEYISGAEWSTPLRRIPEFFATLLPVVLVLSIPVILNVHTIFEWTHKEVVAKDKILTQKAPYLDINFFIVRLLVAFAIWMLYYFAVARNSRKQDTTKDQKLTKKNIVMSAIFIPFFAITVTVFSIDWIMSLAPHWFSTIFGVYYFAGSFVGALAITTYTAVKLWENGYLHPKVNVQHFYSLGGLLFGFTNFWAYIGFSQFMLIWYANLPEETSFFLHRWGGQWTLVSLLLIVVHFAVPYAVLLSQPAKMDPKRLKFISIWMIFARFVDFFWLVMPNYREGHSSLLFVVFDLALTVALIGLLVLAIYFNAKKTNLTPIGDPKLDKGLNFKL